MELESDRRSEWFVPRWGPLKFRIFVGLLFLPYTGMVLSFTVIGAMLAQEIFWDRVVAALIVYFLGLGIAAHALDALGSQKVKPWGKHFNRTQLWVMAILSLVVAYAIAAYYMVRYVPLLWAIAILEGFFVFAYNLEWFKGKFHSDGWFAFSWGMLPVVAGYVLQTNRISLAAAVIALAMGLLSYVEITASRPYKDLKRASLKQEGSGNEGSSNHMMRYEKILKSISCGVIFLGIAMAIYRIKG